MKKLILAAALTASAAAFADLKLGVVDMLLLVRNHPNYESNKALLASTDKDYQQKIEAIKGEGEALQEEFKKLAEQIRNPMLLPKAKAEAEKKVGEMQQKMMAIEQRFRSEAMRCRQDLQDLEARLLKTTEEDLRKRMAKFAGENGYDLILAANAAPFADPKLDVTDAMLKQMGVEPKDAKGRNEGK